MFVEVTRPARLFVCARVCGRGVVRASASPIRGTLRTCTVHVTRARWCYSPLDRAPLRVESALGTPTRRIWGLKGISIINPAYETKQERRW